MQCHTFCTIYIVVVYHMQPENKSEWECNDVVGSGTASYIAMVHFISLSIYVYLYLFILLIYCNIHIRIIVMGHFCCYHQTH